MTPFDAPEALELNRARIEHLESLNLDLKGKRVLDVGCGVGHFSKWFIGQGAKVTGLDIRSENLRQAVDRTMMEIIWQSIETIEPDEYPYEHRRFDIVFCYGLLYHLENPLRALRHMAALCEGILLLETIVCDHPAPLLMLRKENTALEDQGVSNLSTVPTPNFVLITLKAIGFPFVYWAPNIDHPQFQWVAKHYLACDRNGAPIRMAFSASREPLGVSASRRPAFSTVEGSTNE